MQPDADNPLFDRLTTDRGERKRLPWLDRRYMAHHRLGRFRFPRRTQLVVYVAMAVVSVAATLAVGVAVMQGRLPRLSGAVFLFGYCGLVVPVGLLALSFEPTPQPTLVAVAAVVLAMSARSLFDPDRDIALLLLFLTPLMLALGLLAATLGNSLCDRVRDGYDWPAMDGDAE